ncbi:ABC transporter permease subunit [Calidithermus roseus]|uniref:Urea ABC transporter, permease protein UrtB n=1 Tax=Calidithermus roseus TaxID=1644118 RepID=A0A399F3A2_9DEIN|nr:hypothetical protein [Calidithermus roseus]RIH89091.1 urea ABC transporter, permease protein UrtB [Calidithermus roseus]
MLTLVLFAVGVVLIQRLLELGLAYRNLHWALERGGGEYGREHYPYFFLLHGAWLLGVLFEGGTRQSLSPLWPLWLLLFLALTMIGLGVAGLLGKRFEGFPLFNQAPEWPFTLGAVLLALLLAFGLAYTRLGLVVRSVGENPAAADALGVDVVRVRYLAVAFGGAMAGLAGAFLSLSYRPSWTDGMTVGLGWIAVALVIFVGWSPLRAIGGAIFFGLLYYLQFRLQGQSGIPTEFFAAMPYLLVIVVLALAGLRRVQGAAPEALGRPYQRGER